MAMLDEMVDGSGGVRPHWRSVLGVLTSMDAGQLHERALRLQRAAEEDGAATSWRLDPVPLPLPAAEFAALEAGLCQRAALLEAVLADLYGPQSLLAEGEVPAALVFPNPAFLRACRGSPAPGGRFLQAYAADLLRGPDGQWRVLADRTGGALGIGYAREGRRLLARVLPELFRTTQTAQLRPFFEAWGDALLAAAAPAGRTPFIALLTPGVTDPHWPEHLALSRDLNCALVQTRDLTARGGVLHLKTLLGLQPVDVLLRRVPGDAIDPLELHAPGPGVTGLLDAARNGAVRILNHPGTALIEAPALAAFLPRLSRRLLGEPLQLATVPTLWLADDGAQHRIGQAPDRWRIRPALDPARPPAALGAMPAAERQALNDALVARPWAFAASTVVPPSVTPCLGVAGTGPLLDPRPVVLRLFLMHDGARWQAMPGGLARVLTADEHVTEALPPGALFKDVWVLREERAEIRGPEAVRRPPVAIRRSVGDLPSRVADDFFWLGRYVERLDVQARLARAGLLRSGRGAPLPREVAEISTLLACLAQTGMVDDEDGSPLPVAVRLSLDANAAAGSVLGYAAGLTEALRDRMTPETHGAITHAHRAARADMDDAIRQHKAGGGVDALMHAMTGLQRLANTLAGVASEGMVRSGGWLFLDLGRRIERAYLTTQMLAVVLDQPAARMDSTLALLLELCDSAITYRNRYLSAVQPAPVLDLILADPDNPRGLGFQFAQSARLLAQAGDRSLAAAAMSLLGETEGLVDAVLAAPDPYARAAELSPALLAIGRGTADLSSDITRRFFALLPALRAVGFEVA